MGIIFLDGVARDGFAAVTPGKLWRFDGTAAVTRCSAGWPGTPGMFTDATIPNVRGFVDGVEVPIAVQALRGKHPDGSYRAIGVQVRTVASFVKRAFRLEIWSTARSVGNTLAWIEPTQEVPGGEDATDWPAVVHKAVIAPTDPAYLCNTFVALQPLMPATEDVASVAAWTATMEAQWTASIANGTNGGTAIYDHALGCWAYYCRTGDRAWYEWAYKWGVVLGGPEPGSSSTAQTIDFTLSDNPGTPTNDAIWNPEGLTGSNSSGGSPNEQHSLRLWSSVASYWMTAYRQPMRYVARQANRATAYVTSLATADNLLSSQYSLRFNFGRSINAILAGYLVEATTEIASSGDVAAGNLDNYPQMFSWVLSVLENNEYALGDYRDGMVGLKSSTTDVVGINQVGDPGGSPVGAASDWQLFQTAVVAEFSMIYYDLVDDDPRIPVWLETMGTIVDGQTRASVSGESGYPASSVACYFTILPASIPASGLNGWTLPMHAPMLAWLWRYTNNTAWRDLCDAVIVPEQIDGLTMQTKLWGELWGGTRQAFAYYRNGGTIRGTTGIAGSGAVQPTTHAELG